jgi:hypothetical protein
MTSSLSREAPEGSGQADARFVTGSNGVSSMARCALVAIRAIRSAQSGRSIRSRGLIGGVRFALFIETDSVPVEVALRLAVGRVEALQTAMSAADEQAVDDPALMRAEIKHAGRLRAANSVLR